MRIYFDPSILVALYVEERASSGIRQYLLGKSLTVLLNQLQEFEIKNSIRQKVTRGEISESTALRSLRLLDDDFVTGVVVRKAVAWAAVYHQAEKLSRKLAMRQSCRSFDLLHVAIAMASAIREFGTFDQAQAEVAEAAGLKILHLASD